MYSIGFISLDDLNSWEQGYSPINISCSSHATELELSSCSVSTSYLYSTCISSPLNCTSPKAIRCYSEHYNQLNMLINCFQEKVVYALMVVSV